MAAVSLDDQTVSSTRIRETIRAGNLDAASQMLGRPYAIAGRVIRGRWLGRNSVFRPRILTRRAWSCHPGRLCLVIAKIGKKSRPVALNIGFRPTLATDRPQLRVEAHLLDFTGDLYGQELEIEVGEKLRDEQKFGSLEELKAQIAQDIAGAKTAISDFVAADVTEAPTVIFA